MDIEVVGTGSSGNCVILNKSIMIDCGLPMKKIRPYVKDIKLVLLTHIHSDHFNARTVRALAKERPTLRWCCCDWMVEPLVNAGVDKRVIDVAQFTEPGYTSKALIYNNLCLVDPIPLVHDVPNCGWDISIGYESLFYATDTGTLDGIELPNRDIYAIEANHTTAEIEERIARKEAAGEFCYERRAAANHLSQEQAFAWLAENMGANSKYIFLHQHKED